MEIGTFARHHEQVESALEDKPDFIDLRLDLNHSLNFKETKKLLAEYEIGCTLHLPSSPDWKPIDIAKEIVPFIDLGREVNAELISFHSTLSSLFFSDRDIDAFLESVPIICDTASEHGLSMAVETLGTLYTELAILFERCPEINLVLDIGHEQIMAYRNRALDLIADFPKRIAMVNVHDNDGKDMIDELRRLREKSKSDVTLEEVRDLAVQYDTHQQISTGCIDFDAVFSSIKTTGYDGKFLMMAKDPSKFSIERKKFLDLWYQA